MSGLLERLPTAHLLPIVARTENSALPFKRQLWTKYLIPRGRVKAHDRSSSLDILSRAPESCFARVRTRNQKHLRRAAIALTYSRLTTYGPCKPSYLIGPGDKVITVAPFYPVTPAISRGSNPMSPAGNAHGQPGASPSCCSAAWPLAASAQQRPLPTVVLLNSDACRFDENERGRTFVAQHR
jgi:hypothetical protein